MLLLERFKNFTTGTPRRIFISFLLIASLIPVVLLANTRLQGLTPKAEDRPLPPSSQVILQERLESEGGELIVSKPSGIKKSEDIVKYEPSDRKFVESEIGAKTVYYHQRTIDGAIVEKDFINYQFDRETEEFLEKKSRWRPNLPEQLPPLKITKEQAMSMVEGEPQFSNLYIISPDSDVFPLDPTPENPCWVVNSVKDDIIVVTIIDATTGETLGYGVPPPSRGFSLSGPEQFPCRGAWVEWYLNAKEWFERMGYPTIALEWPNREQMQEQIEDPTTTFFYEIAHGGSSEFSSGCLDGYGKEKTHANDVREWMTEREKTNFAFIGSCGGMCYTDSGTFSYEFRKGSMQETATVGYCGMGESDCSDCWDYIIEWQEDLFDYMYNGNSVKDAFDRATADYPTCGGWHNCVRFAGDESYEVKADASIAKLTFPPPDLTIGGRFYIRGTAGAPEDEPFTNYAIDYALEGTNEWYTDGITLLSGEGTNPVVDGDLAIWDTRSLPFGNYHLRLRVNPDAFGAATVNSVKIEPSQEKLRLGWPVGLGSEGIASPIAIGDVNGDGTKELVFYKNEKIHIYQHDGTLLWSKDVVSDYASKGDQYFGSKAIYPVLGDIDPAFPGKEIVTQLNPTQVVAWHGDGSVVDGWPVDTGLMAYRASPVVDDLDGNGDLEIVIPSYRGDSYEDVEKLYVFDGSGGELWSQDTFALYFPQDQRTGLRPYSRYAALAADINGNGKKEIILRFWNSAAQSSQIMALDGVSGNPAYGWQIGPLEFPFKIWSPMYVALGDIDSDGASEIIVASETEVGTSAVTGVTNTFIVRGDRTFLDGWNPKAVPFEATPSSSIKDYTYQIVLGDLTNDAIPEIVHLGWKHLVLALDPTTGERVPGFDGATVGTIDSYTTVGDIDSDENREFVTNGNVGIGGDNDSGFTLYRYNNTTSVVEELQSTTLCLGVCPAVHQYSPWRYLSPALADLDGDGKTEILAPYHGWIYVFDSNETTGLLDWPQYLHDERRTGAYTTSEEPVCVPESLLPGDLDCDCDVDVVDIMMVAAIWNTEEGDDRFRPEFDFDDDGRISVADIMYIAAKWNTRCP